MESDREYSDVNQHVLDKVLVELDSDCRFASRIGQQITEDQCSVCL